MGQSHDQPKKQGNKSTTSVNPHHVKVKDTLTRNYCITVNIEKISSKHQFILEILKIFEYQGIKDGQF